MRIISYFILIGFFFNCNPTNKNQSHQVKEIEESLESQKERAEWFELMHTCKEGTNWVAIEYQNSLAKVKAKQSKKTKNGLEEIVPDLLYGNWKEIGSNNQSGSVHVTTYDREKDEIWLISDGGTLYKGPRSGNDWEVVNQDYNFGKYLLEFIDVPNAKRLLASISSIPHYSDDLGLTWQVSSGLPSVPFDLVEPRNFVFNQANGKNFIFCEAVTSFNGRSQVYVSKDNGESYELLLSHDHPGYSRTHITKAHNSNRVFYSNTDDAAEAYLYEFNFVTEKFDVLISETNQADISAFFTANVVNNEVIFYAEGADLNFYRSLDYGANWELRGSLPKAPWEVEFYNSPSNPNQIFMGEIECYISNDGGKNWTIVNETAFYEDDRANNLHADIMYFNEFERTNGETFQLISTHAGLCISYDYLESVSNLSLEKLNVSQYYDVRTDPNDPSYIFAGSQDQGLQRVNYNEDISEPLNFDKLRRGDFGHLTYSGVGDNFWFIYPWNKVWLYYNPKDDSSNPFAYSPIGINGRVWLAPLHEIPETTENKILMAGGNAESSGGSYLIELSRTLGQIEGKNLPFDFYADTESDPSAIEVSTINPELYYVSTANGFFYKSEDAGQSWTTKQTIVPTGDNLYGTSIYASKNNENIVYAAGSGYSNPPVFYSEDQGASFTPFSEGLPPTLVYELTANADETMIFAATETGPYIYLEETASWHDLSGLAAPNVTYRSVEFLEEKNIIRFGTYGRGIWDFEIEENPTSTKEISAEQLTLSLAPNPTNEVLNITLENLKAGDYALSILNVNGQMIQNIAIQHLQNGAFKKQIEVNHLVNGNYFISLSSKSNLYHGQFVKTN